MANDQAKSQRSFGTTSWAQGWPDSSRLWKNQTDSALLNGGSRGSSPEGAPAVPDSRPQATETDSYRTNLRGANISTRNTPGSTSPASTRDKASLPFQTNRQPAIGQRAAMNSASHWHLNPRADFQASGYLNNSAANSGGVFGQDTETRPESHLQGSFTTDSRNSHEPYFGTGAPTFPRDNPRAVGNRAGTDHHTQGTHYNPRGYELQNGRAGQPQRLSFGSHDGTTRTVTNSSNGLEGIMQKFAGTSLNDFDGPAEASSATGSLSTFTKTTNRLPWMFNPATQSWDNGLPQANPADGHLQGPRGLGVDLTFPAGGPYTQGRDGATQPVQNLGVPETSYRGRSQPVGGPSVLPSHLARTHLIEQQTRLAGTTAVSQQFNVPYGRMPNLYEVQYQSPHMHGVYNGAPHNRPLRNYDAADARRSALLRDFRMSQKTSKRYELRDIYNHVVEFCGDQHGSRFIQEKLERANSDEKERIFGEIIREAIPLMKDTFGNYVLQKIFEHGTLSQKQRLAETMEDSMVSLTFDQYGCRVVQKAFEYVLSDQRSALIRQLEPQVLSAMKDQHGNHVIQKALEFGDQDDLEFVFRSLRGKVRELACHATACRVVQKAMDRFTEPRNAIIDEVLPHTLALANDKYGNYVIQHVLEMGRPEDKTRIIDMVLGGSIVHLSKQKFASNVVEKCVMNGTPEEKLKIETQMTATGPDGNSFLYSMIVDQYANYVIQKHMAVTPNEQAFSAALRPALQWARNSGYSGKHVDTIGHLLEETSQRLDASTAPTSPLQLDVGSAAPTPNLTMEPNSPSSSPPSTTESAVDDVVGEPLKAQLAAASGRRLSPEVRLAEDDS